jgi:putative ABC transport system substrate-binding protein
MVAVGDPVRSGFISSLARPGGNITGLSIIAVELSAKLVELFADLVPAARMPMQAVSCRMDRT